MKIGAVQSARFIAFRPMAKEHDKSRTLNFYGTNAFGIGRSPVDPNCTICVPAVDLPMNHVAFDGRNTVASNLPSPS